MVQVDPVARVSKTALSLIIATVFFTTVSAVAHTRVHPLSYLMLGLAGITGALALLKIANSLSQVLPRQMAHVIHWIHAMVFELLALMAISLLRVMKDRSAVGGKSGRPILLIHGYCNDGSVWMYVRNYLAKEHLGPIYIIDLGHPFRSISEYAEKVSAKASEIERETGRSDLMLVGHSMGGLVSSLYALRKAVHGTVTDVITIGSPLAGTHVAKIGIGPNAKEMRRSSQFVQELNEQLNKQTSIRFYHIATETDQMVIPSGSALCGQCPEREFLFRDLGHASLLFSPRVAALLAHWLKMAAAPEIYAENA